MTSDESAQGPVDDAAITTRAEEVSHLLSIHGGGIEVESVSTNGDVHVGFTGMCTGCPFRAVTLAATIRPALSEIEGVTSVEAAGVRISEHAARRLAAVARPWWGWRQHDEHAANGH